MRDTYSWLSFDVGGNRGGGVRDDWSWSVDDWGWNVGRGGGWEVDWGSGGGRGWSGGGWWGWGWGGSWWGSWNVVSSTAISCTVASSISISVSTSISAIAIAIAISIAISGPGSCSRSSSCSGSSIGPTEKSCSPGDGYIGPTEDDNIGGGLVNAVQDGQGGCRFISGYQGTQKGDNQSGRCLKEVGKVQVQG